MSNGDPGTRRKHTTCVLAESHDDVRSSLAEVLGHEGFTVVGAASTGYGALALVELHHPDLIVADYGLPDMTGIDVARVATTLSPASAVVLHSRHETPRSIVPDALAAGIRGIVVKAVPASQLLLALEATLAGGVHVDPALDGWDRRVAARAPLAHRHR